MKESEFWARMEGQLGAGYARVWADQQHLAGLDGCTVGEALRQGWECKQVWRAVAAALELPLRET